jgi:hypothetical protein
VDAGSAVAILELAATTQSTNGVPVINVLAGPSWQDQIAANVATASYLPSGGAVNIVIFDAADVAGYAYSLNSLTVTGFTTAAESSDFPNTPAGATVAVTLPYRATPVSLSSGTDVDVVKVTLGSAAHIHAMTVGADSVTDTQLNITNAAGTSYTGGPVDNDFDENVVTVNGSGDPATVPAGDYYVQVDAGIGYSAAHANYTLLIWTD